MAQRAELPGWRLVWQDEFDGAEVDATKWESLTRLNSFNNEKQSYLPEQASVVDGHLRITATNEPHLSKKFRSARLESWESFGPGRFEARIDLPATQGMWPAFWLLPNDPDIPWPAGGEIDILENRGSQPNVVSSAYHCKPKRGPAVNFIASFPSRIQSLMGASRSISTAAFTSMRRNETRTKSGSISIMSCTTR